MLESQSGKESSSCCNLTLHFNTESVLYGFQENIFGHGGVPSHKRMSNSKCSEDGRDVCTKCVGEVKSVECPSLLPS